MLPLHKLNINVNTGIGGKKIERKRLTLTCLIKNTLRRWEESDTYLTHVCRYRWNRQITMKVDVTG